MEGHIFITLSHNDMSEAFFATSNDLLLYESMKELYSPFFGKLSVRMRYRKRERVRESQREIYKVLGCIWIIFLIRFEMRLFWNDPFCHIRFVRFKMHLTKQHFQCILNPFSFYFQFILKWPFALSVSKSNPFCIFHISFMWFFTRFFMKYFQKKYSPLKN